MSTEEREGEWRLRALRGATIVDGDDPAAIVSATAELLRAMLERNGVAPGDIVSIIFTATPDLVAEFPATAARKVGISHVPLLCAAEIAVSGAIPRCIRVLMHVYTDRDSADLQHVYLGEARRLRRDLPGD